MRKTFSKKTCVLLVGIIAALAFAGVAAATVTFDPSSGNGFVGKGDVQTAFGWNNATAQAQANNVSFSMSQVTSTDYAVTCEWDTGTIHLVHHVQTTQHSVSDTLAYDVTKANRSNPQGSLTGYNLTGLGTGTTTPSGDPIPAVGEDCPGNSGLGPITDVEIASSSSVGGLYVSDSTLSLGPTLIYSF